MFSNRKRMQTRHMNEEYLTVAEVAEMLDVSRDTVRRIFAMEPGVIDLASHGNRTGRPYRTLRIPRSTLERVLAGRAVQGECERNRQSEGQSKRR